MGCSQALHIHSVVSLLLTQRTPAPYLRAGKWWNKRFRSELPVEGVTPSAPWGQPSVRSVGEIFKYFHPMLRKRISILANMIESPVPEINP